MINELIEYIEANRPRIAVAYLGGVRVHVETGDHYLATRRGEDVIISRGGMSNRYRMAERSVPMAPEYLVRILDDIIKRQRFDELNERLKTELFRVPDSQSYMV